MEDRVRETKKIAALAETDAELHLLLLNADLQDDISSYRRREAAWISLIVHAVIIVALILSPKWLNKSIVLVPLKDNQQTFLSLPPDQLKVKPPKTNVVSDMNRVAQSRTPAPTKDTLRKLLDARAPGLPAPPAAPPPSPVQQAMQEHPATTQGIEPVAPQPPAQTAKLQAPVPSTTSKSPFDIGSPGSAVNQAIHSVASSGQPGTSGVTFGRGGEYGGLRPKVDTRGGLEILSDTMGVDFGPYMQRLKVTVQNHWDPLIPESAMPPMMKKGTLVIEFAITKDGKVIGMKLIQSSGDVALDRAAWGAITGAIPLNPLPNAFAGEYLLIRARFYYNPDKNDFE
jgi:TonB family protein